MQEGGMKDSYIEHGEGGLALLTGQASMFVFDVLAHSLRVGV